MTPSTLADLEERSAPQVPLTAADLADFTDWSHQTISDLNQQELEQFIMDDDTDAGGWITN